MHIHSFFLTLHQQSTMNTRLNNEERWMMTGILMHETNACQFKKCREKVACLKLPLSRVFKMRIMMKTSKNYKVLSSLT